MKSAVVYICVILLVLLSFSCKKIQQLPPEPRIEFRQFSMSDTIDILGNDAKTGRLEFYFEDGDGDMGLLQPLDGETDTTNLFFTLYRKEDGVFVQASESDALNPPDYRIPFMERLGQNKILQGTIKITFLYFFYESTDTIMYEFFIKDRTGNESNTESTCEIHFALDGACIDTE